MLDFFYGFIYGLPAINVLRRFTMPLFAHEVIAFQVAIFLTLFSENTHCGRYLTAVEVAALLSEAAKGLNRDDTLQPNCNFYININPITLRQGFWIFKVPLQK